MIATSLAAVLDFPLARFNMIESQLRPNQVNEPRLLSAFGKVPREAFVPSTLIGVAYLDENIPLISKRVMMQPLILGRLLQAAQINETDHVLDLAPATGYSTILLSSLAKSVVAVEPDGSLIEEAERNKEALAADNVEILAGAPVEGCAARAPFDAIVINGSVEYIPEILFDQLKDGGRIVTVFRHYNLPHVTHTGQGRCYVKKKGFVTWAGLFNGNAPEVPGFAIPQGFSF